MRDIGVPLRYRDASLTDFPPDVQNASVVSLEKDGVFITGVTGSGKTHLAAGLLRRVYESGHFTQAEFIQGLPPTSHDRKFGMWTSVPEFIGALLSGIRGDDSSRSPEWTIKTAQHAGVLVMDDLGAEKTSEFTLSAIYRVLDFRINELKTTIVTSNLSLQQIDAWEPRIASRLAGLGVIELEGADRRINA